MALFTCAINVPPPEGDDSRHGKSTHGLHSVIPATHSVRKVKQPATGPGVVAQLPVLPEPRSKDGHQQPALDHGENQHRDHQNAQARAVAEIEAIHGHADALPTQAAATEK